MRTLLYGTYHALTVIDKHNRRSAQTERQPVEVPEIPLPILPYQKLPEIPLPMHTPKKQRQRRKGKGKGERERVRGIDKANDPGASGIDREGDARPRYAPKANRRPGASGFDREGDARPRCAPKANRRPGASGITGWGTRDPDFAPANKQKRRT